MVKRLFKSNDTLPIGLDLIRVISGGIIFTFGLEILDPNQMAGYTEWLTSVGMPLPKVMAYIGKCAEFVCGLCLSIGFLTRLSTIPLMITMCVINFIMLEGNLRSDPFYLLLIFTSFLFLGGGKISVDHILDKKESTTT